MPEHETGPRPTAVLSDPSTYKEFALIDVFAPAVGIFDLFAEYKGHLKKKEVALSTLTNKSLWVPHLKGLLKDEFTLGLNVFIKSWQKKIEKEPGVSTDI